MGWALAAACLQHVTRDTVPALTIDSFVGMDISQLLPCNPNNIGGIKGKLKLATDMFPTALLRQRLMEMQTYKN